MAPIGAPFTCAFARSEARSSRRLRAAVGDDLAEVLDELDAEVLERLLAVLLGALELGILAREELLGEAEDRLLVGLGHAEDRAEDAERVL